MDKTTVLLSTWLDSATIPFLQEKLQAALEKLMADKKEFENWKDDLQKERNYWEASGDPS